MPSKSPESTQLAAKHQMLEARYLGKSDTKSHSEVDTKPGDVWSEARESKEEGSKGVREEEEGEEDEEQKEEGAEKKKEDSKEEEEEEEEQEEQEEEEEEEVEEEDDVDATNQERLEKRSEEEEREERDEESSAYEGPVAKKRRTRISYNSKSNLLVIRTLTELLHKWEYVRVHQAYKANYYTYAEKQISAHHSRSLPLNKNGSTLTERQLRGKVTIILKDAQEFGNIAPAYVDTLGEAKLEFKRVFDEVMNRSRQRPKGELDRPPTQPADLITPRTSVGDHDSSTSSPMRDVLSPINHRLALNRHLSPSTGSVQIGDFRDSDEAVLAIVDHMTSAVYSTASLIDRAIRRPVLGEPDSKLLELINRRFDHMETRFALLQRSIDNFSPNRRDSNAQGPSRDSVKEQARNYAATE